MKQVLILISLFLVALNMNAQFHSLPPYPKKGKCYVKITDYSNIKITWKEINCDSLINKPNPDLIESKRSEIIAKKIKLKRYQEKLKSLGYKVEINGIVDKKTYVAHKKYLRKLKRSNN